MNCIECHQLAKQFRSKAGIANALAGIDLTVPSGCIAGLLGPDGAGKTTLLRILAGLLRPDAGSAKVLGFDAVRDAAEIQRRVGYMPQKFGLYENLTVTENLKLYADLHGIPEVQRRQRFDRLLALTMLGRFGDRWAGKLSGGMKQKLALACSLVSNPELLLLDEPTVGVDVLSRRELWKILRELSADGKLTVLVSTAYMDEADHCDRTFILFEGRLLADAPPGEIRRKAGPDASFENGFLTLLTGGVPKPLVRRHPPEPQAVPVIRAEKIVKRFGTFRAVDQVSFEVRPGEIFGLLGANGAGKTTTFRMLCGLSRLDGGSIEVAGMDLEKNPGAIRMKIGYVAQKFSLYGDLTVRENLEFFGGAYSLHGRVLHEKLARIREAFRLESCWNTPSGRLPPGHRQRLSMGCALLHDPQILFLDEATSGADPMTRREFWERIMALADSGVAIIITTHFLDEAAYCDRMVIMQNGVAIASGSADEIRRAGESDSLEEAFVNLIARSRREAGS